MDPVTAAINAITAFLNLQNLLFTALPPEQKATVAAQLNTDLQALRTLLTTLGNLVKGG